MNTTTTSPLKMAALQDLASGQANIGTPIRSRLDSHDSRMGAFPGYNATDNITFGPKLTENRFQSPLNRFK